MTIGAAPSLRLDARRELWSAMSELFLDTEVRWYIPAVARSVADAPFSAEEVDRIWYHEAMPEFKGNLLVVAGEWAALTYDESRLIARAGREPRWLEQWWARRVSGMMSPIWAATCLLADRLRREDIAARRRYEALWRGCASAFVEPSLDALLSVEHTALMLHDCGLDASQCHASAAKDFMPAYEPLLAGNERRERTQRIANVHALIDRAFAG
jgi:hypothetical protein